MKDAEKEELENDEVITTEKRFNELKEKEKELETIKETEKINSEKLVENVEQQINKPVEKEKDFFACADCDVEIYDQQSVCSNCGKELVWE